MELPSWTHSLSDASQDHPVGTVAAIPLTVSHGSVDDGVGV